MQRSRTSEESQRPASKIRGPQNLRTSSSGSDRLQNGPISERTPKLGIRDRPSPRSVQSEPVRRKKLGTRITDLETQLIQAQHELKSLKQQLSSAEAAKKQAQEELHRKGIKRQPTTRKVQGRVKQPIAHEIPEEERKDKSEDDEETDVFEVPEPEKPSVCDVQASKGEAMDNLRSDVEEKKKMVKVTSEENETLKRQLEEARIQISSAQKNEEDMTLRLNQLVQELELNKTQTAKLQEKVLEVEGANESLETEMKKMKVQTEQWRKAADAAAAVLAGGPEMNCRVSERCGSMDKNFNGILEKPFDGYKEYLGDDDIEDDFDGGKKKGSGIRMLGDLWKKKGHK